MPPAPWETLPVKPALKTTGDLRHEELVAGMTLYYSLGNSHPDELQLKRRIQFARDYLARAQELYEHLLEETPR